MSKTKLTNLELNKLVTAGLGVSEIARRVGVSKGTVSKRLKALNVAVTKDVTLRHAGQIVEMKLDAIGQLQKINDNANELLDLLMRWNWGDEEALSKYWKARFGRSKSGVRRRRLQNTGLRTPGSLP